MNCNYWRHPWLYLSHGTLVCRDTPVENHWSSKSNLMPAGQMLPTKQSLKFLAFSNYLYHINTLKFLTYSFNSTLQKWEELSGKRLPLEQNHSGVVEFKLCILPTWIIDKLERSWNHSNKCCFKNSDCFRADSV